MKQVLILVYNDLIHDARVRRQINFLKDDYKLTVVCFNAPEDLGVEVIKIRRIRPGLIQKAVTAFLLLTRFFEAAHHTLYDFPALRQQLKSRSFDLIIANDIETLPLAIRIKKNEKILFDAHEFAPRHFEDKLSWRIFFQAFNKYLCRKYLPLADRMITIGEGLAKEYAKYYPVHPVVITNANYYFELSPNHPDPKNIRLIHHGAANPSRQLEIMIEMMDYVDKRFTLDLMLLTPTIANKKTRAYLDTLRKRAEQNPRIKIVDPVRSDQVVQAIHQYDIGVFLIRPINFNYANGLPNKLFDFVQARLAIAVGPTPEMASLVKKYDLGVVSKEFTPQSLAQLINELTPEKVFYHKQQSEKAARAVSAENNQKILKELVAQLVNS